jgi:hypothetical protein
VSPRTSARTAPCIQADARARLRKAQSFVTGAELALGVGDDPLLDLPGVAAVLAGIAPQTRPAASRSGSGSRPGTSGSYRPGPDRTTTRSADGPRLERLIQKKDNAHYGMIPTTDTEAHAMLAWAQRLITCASATVAG